MGVLADHQIRAYVAQYRMIEPFVPELVRTGVVSFGTGSYGYDFRLAREFVRLAPHVGWDPKRPFRGDRETFAEDAFWIAPGEVILARSLEYFRIPRDILAVVFGKSTYARCGLVVNVTPLEPEWEGYITVALINGGRYPIRVYAEEGIAQVIFLRADAICQTSYADRKGKYQQQRQITLPTVHGA